jgi:hypothetical protein
VEDDLGPVALEDLPELGAVPAVGEHRHARGEVALLDELALDLEERRLRRVDEHEPRRLHARDLAAELGADRTAGARDEHGLPGEVRGDGGQVDLDRLAAEDVLDLHGADLGREAEVAGDQLVQARQRLHWHALGARHLDDPTTKLARRGGDRDQHLVGPVVAQDVRQVVGRAEHAHAEQAHSALARVIVDEPDRRRGDDLRALELLHDQPAGIAGADDQHLPAARDDPALGPLDHGSREQARARDEGEQQQRIDERHPAGQPQTLDGVEEVDGRDREHRRNGDARHRTPHVARRHVAPPALVEAERDEDGELDRDDEDDRLAQHRLVEDRHLEVEAQLEREVPRGSDQHRVDCGLPEPMARDRHYTRTPTAERTTSTTRSWIAGAMPGQSGTEKFSAAARSVSGSEPRSQPRKRSAGCRCRGVV